jgi:3-oxoacyl-[acyl-carrier protein] reductase
MDLGLTDRVFLVTGGGRGLGRATAQVLVDEGACVVISGRNQETVDQAAIDLGERAIGVAADNADTETPHRLLHAARERWGRVDGALVSVGGPPPGRVIDITDEQWSTSFDSVFLGAVRLCRHVAEVLPEGGSLALVLSSSVRAPIAGLAVSNGLRPGLAMVAKALADELGPVGIRVNGLMPGRVHTERIDELDAASGDPEAAAAAALRGIPLGRDGQPEEFGRAAAFLLSPAASFITGAMLPVDGGMIRAL